MFVLPTAKPQLLDALFPSVRYNYVVWTRGFKEGVLNAPWNWVIRDNELVHDLYQHATVAQENARRATLLVQLAQATNRHRRLVQKHGLVEQSTVYEIKTQEARAYLADSVRDPMQYPFLADAAVVHEVTLEQAANLVLMRNIQEHQVLRYTEHQRSLFQRRILETPLASLEQVQKELTEYERRG